MLAETGKRTKRKACVACLERLRLTVLSLLPALPGYGLPASFLVQSQKCVSEWRNGVKRNDGMREQAFASFFGCCKEEEGLGVWKGGVSGSGTEYGWREQYINISK